MKAVALPRTGNQTYYFSRQDGRSPNTSNRGRKQSYQPFWPIDKAIEGNHSALNEEKEVLDKIQKLPWEFSYHINEKVTHN